MRVKQLWDLIPLPSKLKLAYSRVTLNLPTTLFFTLALVQCLYQVPLHTWLYQVSASPDLGGVASNSTIITYPIVLLMGNDLLLCEDIPTLVGGPDTCIKAQISTSTSRRSLSATPKFDAEGNLMNVELDSRAPVQTVVSAQCMNVLPWASQSLRATNREDLIFVVYHVWLFGVSLVAVLNESIPHLIAAMVSEALCTLGSGFRIMKTSYFQDTFKRIVVDGSCHGVDLLGVPYFQMRRTVEISIFALNALALVAFIGLAWRLIKTYGKRSFERVHKRPEMNRLYIVISTLCSCIQLAVFYMVAAIGLFIDQLTLGPLRNLVQYKSVYLVVDITLLVLIGPWLILGWTSGRMESKPRTVMFLAFTIMFLAAWAIMFTSQVYRLLLMTWDSFAMTSLAPMVLMFVALLLSIYSWFHLDLGLAEYLKAEEPSHPADMVRWSLAVTSDPEKGGSSLKRYKSVKPQVFWIHPQSPITVQSLTRSDSTSSLSTESHPTTGSMGLMPPPIGLSVVSVPTISHKIPNLIRIRPPPQAVTRKLPAPLDTAASSVWSRHSIAETIVSARSWVEPPYAPPVIKRPLPSNSLPSSIRPPRRSRI